MAVDVTLIDVASGYNRGAVNDNFTAIKIALQDALSRTGSTVNTMSVDIDLDSNDLLNVGSITTTEIIHKGVILTDPSILVGVTEQEYPTVASLLASTENSRGTGAIWEAGGFRYVEVVSGGDVTNSAGTPVQLDVLPTDDGGMNVLAFGAKFDNITDDSAPFIAAKDAAIASGVKLVILPAGECLIEQAGAMSADPSSGVVNGFKWRGAGLGATVVNFINTDAVTNNYLITVNNDQLRINYEGIRFQGNETLKNSKFFKMTGGGQAQAIRFHDCMWYQFDNVVTIDGATNGSEMLFNDCKMSNIYSRAYVVGNVQSVNHQFYGCDFESILGGLFYISAGGDINFFGGSIILQDHPDGAITNIMIELDDDSGSGIGFNNWDFNFHGVRTEINQASTLLLNNSGGTITFNQSNLLIFGTTTRRVATVGDHGKVFVNQGSVNGEWFIDADNASSYADNLRPGLISLDGTYLRDDFSFILEGSVLFGGANIDNKSGVGRVKQRNCRNSQASAATMEALDADYGARYGMTNVGANMKYAIVRHQNRDGGLPQQTSEHLVELPLGAEVIGVRLVHNAQSGVAGQVYYFKSGDGVTTHETWTFDATTETSDRREYYQICDTEAKRTLMFTGDAGNAATSYNGYLIVEYL